MNRGVIWNIYRKGTPTCIGVPLVFNCPNQYSYFKKR